MNITKDRTKTIIYFCGFSGEGGPEPLPPSESAHENGCDIGLQICNLAATRENLSSGFPTNRIYTIEISLAASLDMQAGLHLC